MPASKHSLNTALDPAHVALRELRHRGNAVPTTDRRNSAARPILRAGNRIELLENGEEFFPRVFAVLEAARREILIETFIWFDDSVGRQLHAVLIRAARRGVQVDITVDGYGSADLSDEFVAELTAAGVRLHVFDPRARLFGLRLNVFRRMHRKIVVVDGELAFVGGINYSADHLYEFGPLAKQDYSAEIEGPVVDDIHRFVRDALAPVVRRRRWWQRREASSEPAQRPAAGNAQILFVTRDNDEHRTDIERQYRVAIRAARKEVIIANAYFFPGYRLLREMRRASRRGVRVTLILQGQPDMPIVKVAAGLLHDYLLRSGIAIHEYCERPLHGKVGVADDEWATIGSSNLDPLSLSLNLEANVFVRDRAFNQAVRRSLERLLERHCRQLDPRQAPEPTPWRGVVTTVVFHFLRRFPAWAGWLPARSPKVRSFQPQPAAEPAAGDAPPAGVAASRAVEEARQGSDGNAYVARAAPPLEERPDCQA